MTDNSLPTGWDNSEVDQEMALKLDKLVKWRDLPENHFIAQVEKARLGGNVGLSNGLQGVSKYIYGTHRGRYYLIGADSGVGKTTIADFMFIFNAYKSAKARGKKLYVYYYSFEISLEEKKARWVSYYLQVAFNLSIPADYIQGRIDGMMVTEEHMNWIRMAYVEVEEMMNYCHMIVVEDAVHPTRIFNNLVDYHFDKIGTVHRDKAHGDHKKGRITGWTPKPGEEDAMTMLIIDHMALLMPEQGFDTKQTMDLMSKYCVTLRNLFGLIEVIVQQFNTDITSTYRMSKKGDGIIVPQRIDFGDSRYTFRDANVVLGLIKPFIYDISEYYKYDLTKLGTYFVAMHLMKNRHGSAQRMLPLFMNNIAGDIYDLPNSPTIDLTMQPYYDTADKLEAICRLYSPKSQ